MNIQDKKNNIQPTTHQIYSTLMAEAIKEAQKGKLNGEVPVGALVVNRANDILARAHNRCIAFNDPTAHAEILAIREAARLVDNYRLNEMTIVVTVEPCTMCMGAIINARIETLVFGTLDPKRGPAGSVPNLYNHKKLNHRVKIISGVMEDKCRELLQEFFRQRR